MIAKRPNLDEAAYAIDLLVSEREKLETSIKYGHKTPDEEALIRERLNSLEVVIDYIADRENKVKVYRVQKEIGLAHQGEPESEWFTDYEVACECFVNQATKEDDNLGTELTEAVICETGIEDIVVLGSYSYMIYNDNKLELYIDIYGKGEQRKKLKNQLMDRIKGFGNEVVIMNIELAKEEMESERYNKVREKILILEAWAEGKIIQQKFIDGGDLEWHDIDQENIVWDFSTTIYRVKP